MVDVGDDSLVGSTLGVPFGGAALESGREVEGRVSLPVIGSLDVEGVFLVERVFPVPGECGDAACFPEALRYRNRLVGVFLVPAFVGLGAGCKQEIQPDEHRVLARARVDVLHVVVGLEVGAQRVSAHVAGHDSANRLLAEVFAQETVELYRTLGRFRGDRLCGELEGYGFVGGNVDVVYVNPTPVFLDGDGVCARLERNGGRDVCPPGGCSKVNRACACTVHLEVVRLEIARLVVDCERVLSCCFNRDAREGEVAFLEAHVPCTRNTAAVDNFCLGGNGCRFSFVLGCETCCGEGCCENNGHFSFKHKNSLIHLCTLNLCL